MRIMRFFDLDIIKENTVDIDFSFILKIKFLKLYSEEYILFCVLTS